MLDARAVADALHELAGRDEGRLVVDQEVKDHTGRVMEEEQRLVHVVALLALWRAVEQVGWVEHTGDWDWFMDIQWHDPSDLTGGRKESNDCNEVELVDATTRHLALGLEDFAAGVIIDGKPYPDSLRVTRGASMAEIDSWQAAGLYRGEQENKIQPEIIRLSAIVKIDIREEH